MVVITKTLSEFHNFFVTTVNCCIFSACAHIHMKSIDIRTGQIDVHVRKAVSWERASMMPNSFSEGGPSHQHSYFHSHDNIISFFRKFPRTEKKKYYPRLHMQLTVTFCAVFWSSMMVPTWNGYISVSFLTFAGLHVEINSWKERENKM